MSTKPGSLDGYGTLEAWLHKQDVEQDVHKHDAQQYSHAADDTGARGPVYPILVTVVYCCSFVTRTDDRGVGTGKPLGLT